MAATGAAEQGREATMPTTMVRQQMAASTGALAAERERLEREIEKLSMGLPEEAAEIVRKADDLLAAHGAKIAVLKAKRDQIDAQFDVTERERRRAEAEAHDAQVAAAK